MANFQKLAGDKTTRLDADTGRIVLTLEEKTKVDLWGGGPGGEDLVVDTVDRNVAAVSVEPVRRQGVLSTYELTGMQAGETTLEARLLLQTPQSANVRRTLWQSAPAWAKLRISVLGYEHKQSGGSWGNAVYGSTNPAWKDVKWTSMAYSGCGPTSLAIVMDYYLRLDNAENAPMSIQGTDPQQTMAYTSQHGRAADAAGLPSGTSGPVMMANLSKYWPGYQGRQVANVDEAARLLRAGKPLIFLCHACTTYKYIKDTQSPHTWPGHFMVLLGVENDSDTFWISDPSHRSDKYISRKELAKTQIWEVVKAP